MSSIAIVGMACRFPGQAGSLDGYWDLLERGDCAIGEIPAERWSLDGFYDPRPDIPTRSYSKWGGFLDDVRSFDPGFFGLSPREADAMDPQQRILLEVAYEAVQNAGLTLSELRQSRAGVFIGASNIDYGLLQRFRFDRGDILAGTGTALSIVANRISNTFSLTGPSLVTDTACSSSLIALDTACRHLRDGSCDAALVGGVNVLLDPRMFITFSRAHMLSPTGRIRAFDAAADGFVRGEGIGLVVLRRAGDAVADNNTIFATVEATAVNQDGGTGTITAPNGEAQVAMMRSVLARAGIGSGDVVFAEAHGTGTSVGDPIEVDAIGAVFGGSDRKSPLLIGSSKTNLGHLEPAAGIAGLIKTALALSHGRLPPTIGYDIPNPEIDFSGHNIEVAAKTCRPIANRGGAIGLVNSFGFGGTNACALLKAPDMASTHRSSRPAAIRCTTPLETLEGVASQPGAARAFPVSAPSHAHLMAYAGALAQALDAGELRHRSLGEIGHALGCRRDHFEHRCVVVARSHAGLRERLVALSQDKTWPREKKTDPPGIVTGRARERGKLAFTMTGQGGQSWAMGRELLLQNAKFREFFERFDASFKPVSGWSVIDAMMADEGDSQLDDAAITPAVMFAFQCGLAEIWRSAGVAPDLVVGHSFGEVTAAYLAGGISLDHVAKLVMYRGLIRGEVDRVGTMAAIGLSADDIQPLLPANGCVEIGGYNSPNLVTLTGDEKAIDELIATLNRDDPNIVTRKLALDFAYHSSWFEPVEKIFKEKLGELEWSQPEIPVVSTVTGTENSRFDTDYWWSNLRYPVRYQDGIKRALELGADTFIELGPTRTLSSMTAGCAAGEGVDVTTVSTLQRRWSDFESIATAMGELFCTGYDIDWSGVHGQGHARFGLPPQPWLRETHWQVPVQAGRALTTDRTHVLLGAADDGPVRSWSQTISLETHAFLSDHRINGQIVYPAACYIEAIYEAASRVLATEQIEIRDLECVAALYINPGDEIELRTIFNPVRNRIEIHSRHGEHSASWQLRAGAQVLPFDTQPAASSPRSRGSAAGVPGFYDAIAARGYQYGPRFRCLNRIFAGGGSAFARLESHQDGGGDCQGTNLPAPLLDSALQLMLAPSLPGGGGQAANEQYLPVWFGRIEISGKLASGTDVVLQVRRHGHGKDLLSDLELYSPDGSVCVAIAELRARSIGMNHQPTTVTPEGPRFYRERLVEWPDIPKEGEITGPWLVLQEGAATLAANAAEAIDALGERGRRAGASDRHRLCGVRGVAKSARQWSGVLQEELAAHADIAGIIYRPAFSPFTGGGASETAREIAREITQQTSEIIGLGRALQNVANSIAVPRIWILAQLDRFAESASAPGLEQLQHASIPGVVRTLQMECPDLRFHTIALDRFDSPDPNPLVNIVCSEPQESEFVIAKGRVHVARLSAADDDLARRGVVQQRLPRRTGFALNARGGAGPGSLHWTARDDRAPGEDEVQVEITHTGLNFRDVMAVTGVLPADAETSPAIDALGLEFAGRVVATGEGASGFSQGDRVFGMCRGALVRRINIPPRRLYRIPERLSDAEAATLCSAYLTADYALNVVGRLQGDEKILIHNGSGAVGLAAISLAQAAGAQIFVTAGKEMKRRYLRERGLRDVLDSRSLSFAGEILSRTGGEGVDVVLNALSGPFIDKALDCLAPYGRFLEIGKRDVYGDRALGLKSLRANLSFHVIDVAAMLDDRPQAVRQLMDALVARFGSGELVPVAHDVFPASRIEDAFRYFAAADHIGKVVIDQSDPAMPVYAAFSSETGFDPDGTYLVTGGTRGMGLEVARWLRARGAGHVIAASRTGAPGAAGSGDAGEPACAGNPHEFCQLDLTDELAVLRKIEEIQRSGKPLKGIIHAAVVYDDAVLSEMTDSAISNVLGAKAQGGINLTQAVRATAAEVDFFLSFSSAAQVTGWPGQSNYTAANSVLEALSFFQRQQGIPGQCVHWGVFGETGHVAESEAMSSYLANAGWRALGARCVCDLLAKVLDSGEPVLTIADVDWAALGARYAPIARSPRLNGLCLEDGHGARTHAGALWDLNGDMSNRAIQIVQEQVGKVLRVDADTLTAYETISDAGIDSLSAFELRNRLEQETNLEISLGRFVGAPRFDELAELLCSLAREQSERAPATPER